MERPLTRFLPRLDLVLLNQFFSALAYPRCTLQTFDGHRNDVATRSEQACLRAPRFASLAFHHLD